MHKFSGRQKNSAKAAFTGIFVQRHGYELIERDPISARGHDIPSQARSREKPVEDFILPISSLDKWLVREHMEMQRSLRTPGACGETSLEGALLIALV